jgi:hypothetical protein
MPQCWHSRHGRVAALLRRPSILLVRTRTGMAQQVSAGALNGWPAAGGSGGGAEEIDE